MMTKTSAAHWTRRRFVKRALAGSTVLSFGGLVPAPLRAAAAKRSSERVLVVVELAGGNDGLNTVIPFQHDVYRRLRPELAVAAADVLTIADGIGFHSSLRGFANLLEAGRLSVVQGVGYPDPNRSHFESMDIWHTCQRKAELRIDGWLGRFLEATNSHLSDDPQGLHLGDDKQPFALMSRTIRVPSVRSMEQFRLLGTEDTEFRRAVQELTAARRSETDDLLNFVQSSTASALSASERLRDSTATEEAAGNYPPSALGQQLRTVANLICSGLQTSVYYLQLSGFDTHSQQPGAHSGLLKQLSDSVEAFIADLSRRNVLDHVLLLAYSEFGRRVQENASAGTDHGTAGPVFLAGNSVRSGLIGSHPDLDDLQDGDLKHQIDFRQVYAAVIQNWFGAPSSVILKGASVPADILRTGQPAVPGSESGWHLNQRLRIREVLQGEESKPGSEPAQLTTRT